MISKINLIVLLPKFTKSGSGQSVFKLINNLDKQFKIYVICLGRCEYKYKLKKNIVIFELKYKHLSNACITIYRLIKNISKIGNKTIVLSNHHYANVLTILLKFIIKKVKVIGVERTSLQELKIYFSFIDMIKKKLIYFLVNKLYKYADLIISNSKYVQNEIRKISPNNTKTIHPPSISKIYKSNPSFKSKKDKTIKLLTVGGLRKEKNYPLLIRSLKKIKSKCHLNIIGYGTEFNYLKKLSTEVKNHSITFAGHKNVLSKFYKTADIYINTSFFEGFSNALIEAINYELPILASNCPGGNLEILKKNKGSVLFKSNDVQSLEKKLNYVIKNLAKLKKKTQKFKHNISSYSLVNNLIQYKKVFLNI